MEILILSIGVLIVLMALLDALWTTTWNDGGAGPVTSMVSKLMWNLTLKVAKGNHKILSITGPLLLVTSTIVWLLLLWLGWIMIFESSPTSILNSQNSQPADLSKTIWYVGYSLVTLGNGDLKPTDGVWQIVSTIMVATGMSILTLSMTYYLSVVSAVVDKKSFAHRVFSLGNNSIEMLKNAMIDKDISSLETPLNSIATSIAKLTEQYQAYPILQYYHSSKQKTSEMSAIVLLNDLLLLLKVLPREVNGPTLLVQQSLRSTIDTYIENQSDIKGIPYYEIPVKPDFKKLKHIGFDIEEANNLFNQEEERRRILNYLLKLNGWEWPKE